VALAHKMLKTIYAMIRSGSHDQNKTVDYEALSVARNAPRCMEMLRKHGFIETPAAV
jgi:transposase